MDRIVSLLLAGVGVSRGVVIGRARLVLLADLDVSERGIERGELTDELRRYRRAVGAVRKELSRLRHWTERNRSAEIAAFIDSHLLMLDDVALTEGVESVIRERMCNAEWALRLQRDALTRAFNEIADPYLQSRIEDIAHVVRRIQEQLGHSQDDNEPALDPDQPAILVAGEIGPADVVTMHARGIAAIVTERGGPLSHSSILARSLGIPAVAGVRHGRRILADNERLVIDGESGMVLAGAEEGILKYYRARQRLLTRDQKRLRKLKSAPTQTRDSEAVALRANIDLPEDIAAMRRAGAAGVGLYRTEFLYLNRTDLPDEEEQLRAYRRILAAARGEPVVIRTLDLGADKPLAGVTSAREPGSNPALGLRAIRLCLREPSLFMPQLRALLRAAAYGPLRIMLPMVASTRELRQALELLETAKQALTKERRRFDPNISVGAMIEIPAAALSAGQIAREVDFLSIGTNDLIQYTLAIDRNDHAVNHLYDPVHPAILRLISLTLQAGRRTGTPVAMCGEMAGDPRYTRLLLGLGLRDFSMQPVNLLAVKDIVLAADTRRLSSLTRRLLRSDDPARSLEMLDRLNRET